MYLTRGSLMTARACAEEETRYALGFIKVHQDGTVEATDGKMLLFVQPQIEATEPDDDEIVPEDGFLIPREVALEIAKKTPRRRANKFPKKNEGRDSAVQDPAGVVTLSYSPPGDKGLTTFSISHKKHLGGAYPETQQMLSDALDREGSETVLSLALLEKLVKTLKDVFPDPQGVTVSLTVPIVPESTDPDDEYIRSNDSAIVIRASDKNHASHALALFMPMRGDVPDRSDWEKSFKMEKAEAAT